MIHPDHVTTLALAGARKNAFLVFAELVRMAGKGMPSHAALAATLGLDRSGTSKAVRLITDAGLLLVEDGVVRIPPGGTAPQMGRYGTPDGAVRHPTDGAVRHPEPGGTPPQPGRHGTPSATAHTSCTLDPPLLKEIPQGDSPSPPSNSDSDSDFANSATRLRGVLLEALQAVEVRFEDVARQRLGQAHIDGVSRRTSRARDDLRAFRHRVNEALSEGFEETDLAAGLREYVRRRTQRQRPHLPRLVELCNDDDFREWLDECVPAAKYGTSAPTQPVRSRRGQSAEPHPFLISFHNLPQRS